jgi:hypothetical protein
VKYVRTGRDACVERDAPAPRIHPVGVVWLQPIAEPKILGLEQGQRGVFERQVAAVHANPDGPTGRNDRRITGDDSLDGGQRRDASSRDDARIDNRYAILRGEPESSVLRSDAR